MARKVSLASFVLICLVLLVIRVAQAQESKAQQFAPGLFLPSVIAVPPLPTATPTRPIPTPTPGNTPTPIPVPSCSVSPLAVRAVDIRLWRDELPSEYDAKHEGDPVWDVDGVRVSSHAATEFSGDFRYGPAWIWDEIIVYCSAEIAANRWSVVVENIKKQYPTPREHRLEVGQQTYVVSYSDRGAIRYGLVFRQENVVSFVEITGYEDVIGLETIESLADIIEAKLESENR